VKFFVGSGSIRFILKVSTGARDLLSAQTKSASCARLVHRGHSLQDCGAGGQPIRHRTVATIAVELMVPETRGTFRTLPSIIALSKPLLRRHCLVQGWWTPPWDSRPDPFPGVEVSGFSPVDG
jgi:hypothetical protein